MRLWRLSAAKKGKVFVGLSGGVDSSVSAALLKRKGYDVTGVFIKVWYPPFLSCAWSDDRRDAMKVCAQLNIPFLTLDLKEDYKRDVVDYMVSEYRAGRTPNPDVMCNKHIKFGKFLDFARSHGADFVATGHYARITRWRDQYVLLEGKDPEKDQSYFLWTLGQDELRSILFPVGTMRKADVRKRAKAFGLPTADKKDSQGLCFMGKIDVKEFLEHYIEKIPGDVITESGEIIGRHDGAAFYTIGQRHGFEIFEKTTERKPHYIVSKDLKANTLTVSTAPERSPLAAVSVTLEQEHWVSGKLPEKTDYSARIRYRQEKQVCTLSKENGLLTIAFKTPQKGTSTGQSLVLYDRDICLGGGIITSFSSHHE